MKRTKSEVNMEQTINTIHNDVLGHILRYVLLDNRPLRLVNMLTVCKRWYDLITPIWPSLARIREDLDRGVLLSRLLACIINGGDCALLPSGWSFELGTGFTFVGNPYWYVSNSSCISINFTTDNTLHRGMNWYRNANGSYSTGRRLDTTLVNRSIDLLESIYPELTGLLTRQQAVAFNSLSGDVLCAVLKIVMRSGTGTDLANMLRVCKRWNTEIGRLWPMMAADMWVGDLSTQQQIVDAHVRAITTGIIDDPSQWGKLGCGYGIRWSYPLSMAITVCPGMSSVTMIVCQVNVRIVRDNYNFWVGWRMLTDRPIRYVSRCTSIDTYNDDLIKSHSLADHTRWMIEAIEAMLPQLKGVFVSQWI